MTAHKPVPGPVGPTGPTGPAGPRGAQGAIGGLVLTTPPAISIGREIGTRGTSGFSTVTLTTTADVNAGETVFLLIGWDPQVVPHATAVTSVFDSDGTATWSIDALNTNDGSSPAIGVGYITMAVGQFPSAFLSGSSFTIIFDHVASDISLSATAVIGVFSPGASTIASSATANGLASSTTLATGTVTTSASSEFVIASWRARASSTITTFTPLAGWTSMGGSPALDASTHASINTLYKITSSAAAQSPTGTLNVAASNTSIIARYSQGVAWTPLPVVISEKLWVNDPAYGAKGDGVTDDTAAINSAIAAGVAAIGGNGIVAFRPSKNYMISYPLEVLGNVKIEGFEARTTSIKAIAGAFTGSQMLRNWTVTDWNSGIGESDGRTPPSNSIHSGTHGLLPYPQITDLSFDANQNPNISLICWIGPQENSYFRNLILKTSIAVAGNNGIWGFDMRTSSNVSSSFNYGLIDTCTLYGLGWERQINLDGSVGGGSDFQMSRVVFSPAQTNYALVTVTRVIGVHMHNCHWEGATTSSAVATIYLNGAIGFAMTDCSSSVSADHNKPFIKQDRYAGHTETPADLKGIQFYYNGGTPSLRWPGGFILDLWNTIPGAGIIDDHGKTSDAIHMLHHYTGKHLHWTDNTEQLLEKTY